MDPSLLGAHSGISKYSVDVGDISDGLEPVRIPVLGLTAEQKDPLGKFEQYVIDSVLPDGTSISTINPPNSDDGLDSGDSEGEAAVDCDCLSIDGAWACTRGDGGTCECVGEYGNFYSLAGDSDGKGQILNLDALPDRWPLVECSPTCPCLAACGNRLTQKGVQAPLTVRPVHQAGLGLFYTPSQPTDLPQGSFISLYAGEYLTTLEARLRWSAATIARAGEGNYILSLRLPDQVLHIDPRRIGNVGRFLNHSCEPNCVIQVVRWGVGSWPRAAIFTNRDVSAGEELTFDYGNASGSSGSSEEAKEKGDDGGNGRGRTQCLCGSAKCRGWMPYDETL